MKTTRYPRAALAALLGLCPAVLTQAQSPSAAAGGDETVVLNPFAVTSAQDRGYNSTDSVGAGRIDMPLADLTQRVTVINQQLLQDTGSYDIFDAAKYVAGFTAAAAPLSGSYVLHGFNFVSDQRDGFSDLLGLQGAEFFDSSLFDRVELVNGPSGVLYGQTSPGGVINRITKRPLREQQETIDATVGEFHLVRGSVDVTGPVNDKLAYRFVATGQNGNNWTGINKNNHAIAYGAFTYNISRDTSIYASIIWDKAEIAINTPDLWAGPNNTFSTFLNPNVDWLAERDNYNMTLTRNVDFEIVHSIEQANDSIWNMRLKLRAANVVDTRDLYQNTSNPQYYNAAGTLVGNINTLSPLDPSWATMVTPRFVAYSSIFEKLTEINYDLTNRVTSFHHVSFTTLLYGGVNLLTNTSNQYNYPTPNVVVYHQPNGGRVYISNPQSLWGTPTRASDTNTDSTAPNGGGLETLGFFDDQVILNGGARYDWVRSTVTNYNATANAVSENANQQWSRRWGAVVKPKAAYGLSAYFGHSEVFTFSGGFDVAANKPVPNVLGHSNEEGLRWETSDSRVMLSVSHYDGRVSNVQVNTGLITSNGITIFAYQDSRNVGTDYEAWLNLTRSWSLIATVDDSTSKTATGIRARGVPNGVSDTLWTKYTFRDGGLKGFGVGGGYVHTAPRAADGLDTINLPAFDQIDAMVSYERRNWRLGVDVYNLTNDEKPYTGTGNIYLYRNLPRRARVSAEYRF